MRLLREDEEDIHLNEGMQAEENVFSIDYDVWIDEKTNDIKKRNELMRAIGDHIQNEFADIPLFWFRNEVFANGKVVGSWTYPGPAAGRSSHFELIKLVK